MKVTWTTVDQRYEFNEADFDGTLEDWNKLVEDYGSVENVVSELNGEITGSDSTDHKIQDVKIS